MRADESERHHSPRWILWLVAVVCFGPLTTIWLLGALLSPFWVATLALQVAEPQRFAHEPSSTMWDTLWPIICVVTGGVGLVGLLRVLTLSHRERPPSHRWFTLGMVAVGFAALLIFDLPMLDLTIADLVDADAEALVALLVYCVLPLVGGAWLIARSAPFLFADPRRSARRTGDRTNVRSKI